MSPLVLGCFKPERYEYNWVVGITTLRIVEYKIIKCVPIAHSKLEIGSAVAKSHDKYNSRGYNLVSPLKERTREVSINLKS